MKDTTEILLADTYALLELIRGKESYKPYLKKILVTTEYNLIELHYALLREKGEAVADRYFDMHREIAIALTDSSIKSGMRFKLKYSNEKLSYTDCVGHALAVELGIKFLTGDEKFKNKDNVEFVK
jgi:predicted nucleic acid-binding protein